MAFRDPVIANTPELVAKGGKDRARPGASNPLIPRCRKPALEQPQPPFGAAGTVPPAPVANRLTIASGLSTSLREAAHGLLAGDIAAQRFRVPWNQKKAEPSQAETFACHYSRVG